MSTRCDFHGEGLAELAAGRLEPAREGPLREHLAACPECRADLEAIRAVASAAAVPPAGLEARIRAAVRAGAAGAAGAEADDRDVAATPVRRRRGATWRAWALPLAAAAALAAVWVGVRDRGPAGGEPEEEATVAADWYAPYGAWPADGPEVAGEPVLTELSADDLELLLEEMQP